MITEKLKPSDTGGEAFSGDGTDGVAATPFPLPAIWVFSRGSGVRPGAAYLAAGSAEYPFATLALDLAALVSLHKRLIGEVGYRLGAKCAVGDTPENIDCSGYVGWLLSNVTPTPLRSVIARDIVGLGTWHLSEWLKKSGFKRSTVDSGRRTDGVLRVAITLAARNPVTGRMGIGHIALVWNGRTIESHGGRGVNSREWTGKGWQGRCAVFVLSHKSGRF
ncbi:MAG: hypothetical protein H7145_20375 [Akkermansiaceae bacterium]|nr:hypothetical protein [Armatimonadota bacterium]